MIVAGPSRTAFGAGRVARRAAVVIGALFASVAGNAALACTTCFSEAESPVADGIRWGVLAMIGLVFVVQGSFAMFFVNLRRRSRTAGPVGPVPRIVTDPSSPGPDDRRAQRADRPSDGS